MSRLKNVLRTWLPLAVSVTALCLLLYVTVQQSLRQGANDPQIQMAEDAAAALNRGESAKSVVPASQVDIGSSLAPFVAVYAATGKPATSSGLLDGQLPDYPLGALQAAQHTGENRVTWQPSSGVRIASVVVPCKDGYVVAGRSLREVESRVSQMGTLIGLGWILIMAATLLAAAFGEYVFGGR